MPNAAASVAVPVPAAAVLSPALLEALSDPVLVLAPDGRLERLNRAALRRLALEPGTALADLRPALGERLHARLCAALLGEADVLPGALSGEAADAATLAPLEAGRWALVMPLSALPETAGGAQAALPPVARTELALREQVERLTQERRQWFDSVPIGLVIFDAAGLVLQSNPRFAQLAGEVPVDLGEAGAALRDLLGWPGESLARLQPGDGNWWVREREFDAQQPGLQRWLRARVRCSGVRQGLRRYLGLIEDCSAEYRRDQAEQTLEDLHGILESSPVGIASLRGFRVAHCNRRFERMLRVPAGEALGADIRRLLAAGTGEAADTAYDEDGPIGAALADGGLHETEIEVRGDDGQTHWHALSIRRIGPSGEAPQAIAVLSEITRRKAQQAELEHLALERERMALALGQQADRTRAVLDSVLVGIVTADERGRILWLNRSARRMFGGDLGDFLGRPLDIVATPQAAHPFRRTVALFEALRDGEAVQFECQVQACDGRTFWIVGNAVATQGLDGRREMTFAMMDIDQRRQAEARIAEAQASLQRIIEAAPMAIAVCDAATMAVQQLNHVAAGLCGVTAPEQAIGRTPEDLYPPEVAQRLRADFDAALAQPQGVTQREYMLRRKGLDEVWDARFLPLARGAGRVDQLLMVATDVSAQRAAQKAELEAAIAQREMLVQEVHHRIKNNLQGVAGLMQQAANRRPEVRPLIAEVVGQVQAIAQVYGLQVGNTGLLAVRSVVEAIAQSVQRTFGHAIALEVEQAGDAPAAPGWVLPEAESIPIALTLNELFTNAVKHSASAEPVGCRLALQAAGVEIVIRNAGRLHEGFRIDHRPATVSGLGLVRALLPRRHASLTMDEQGGAVRAIVRLAPPVVRSSSPESSRTRGGRPRPGRVRLRDNPSRRRHRAGRPQQQGRNTVSDSPAAAPASASPAAPARGRVLVVDDDRLVLATVVHGLADAGFDIIDADNGDDAILLAREHRPDLALLDIRMDGMSGFDVARYLRDALQVPFVFLSAFSDEATLAQIRALGALASLVKPLDIAQIIPAVEQALAQVRSQRDAALQPPESVPVAAVTRVPAEAPAQPQPLDDMVAIAIGIVMHRFSLDRAAALQRLERLSRQEGRPLAQSCRGMVDALERLALAGGL